MTVLIDKSTKVAAVVPENYVPHPSAENWSREAVEALFALPFMDLILQAQTIHREHHAPNAVQMSQLLSIKTGGCAEDCGYCNQSAHFETGLKAEKLIGMNAVLDAADKAKTGGAGRFCICLLYTSPSPRDLSTSRMPSSA